jgi:hypothetical protein
MEKIFKTGKYFIDREISNEILNLLENNNFHFYSCRVSGPIKIPNENNEYKCLFYGFWGESRKFEKKFGVAISLRGPMIGAGVGYNSYYCDVKKIEDKEEKITLISRGEFERCFYELHEGLITYTNLTEEIHGIDFNIYKELYSKDQEIFYQIKKMISES